MWLQRDSDQRDSILKSTIAANLNLFQGGRGLNFSGAPTAVVCKRAFLKPMECSNRNDVQIGNGKAINFLMNCWDVKGTF